MCKAGSATHTAGTTEKRHPYWHRCRAHKRLLRRVAELGLQVVLASSAPDDELEMLRKALGCDDIIAEATSSRDVDTAKPEPGIVQVALGPSRC